MTTAPTSSSGKCHTAGFNWSRPMSCTGATSIMGACLSLRIDRVKIVSRKWQNVLQPIWSTVLKDLLQNQPLQETRNTFHYNYWYCVINVSSGETGDTKYVSLQLPISCYQRLIGCNSGQEIRFPTITDIMLSTCHRLYTDITQWITFSNLVTNKCESNYQQQNKQ